VHVGVEHPSSPAGHGRRIALLPTTVLGRWAAGLALAFLALVFTAGVVPRAAALGLVCGLVGGAVALIAIVRDRERGVIAFAALVPLLIAVGFVLAEVITGEP
jgi:hypothetical protein